MNASEAWQALKERKNVVIRDETGATYAIRVLDGMMYEEFPTGWYPMTLNDILTETRFEVL